MRRITYAPDTIIKLPSIFGDASDGDVVISSNTTLNDNKYYRNLTIEAGVVVTTNGYRIFCTGTLTNHGTIKGNGSDASGATHGAGATGTELGSGGAGADGRADVGVGANAANLDAPGGGQGGAGGGAPGNAGGSGDDSIDSARGLDNARNLIQALLGQMVYSASTLVRIRGGGGGGGGGNASGAGTVSGGGGGGGGYVMICAKQIDNRDGIIEANGGAGGNASGAGNAGGGGGGGGGFVILIYLNLASGTERAIGGIAGAKVGTGSVGDAGPDGSVVTIPAVTGL